MSISYTVRDGILDRSIGDELLVHRFDTDEVFVLNSDAKLVFEALKQFGSVDEILDFVASRVFGDALELLRAIEQALEQLLAQGLIIADD
jgi:hypothetical protein